MQHGDVDACCEWCGEGRGLPLLLLPAALGRCLQVDECRHGICGVYCRGEFVKPCMGRR